MSYELWVIIDEAQLREKKQDAREMHIATGPLYRSQVAMSGHP